MRGLTVSLGWPTRAVELGPGTSDPIGMELLNVNPT
jgi:hypothetical protein